MHITTIWDCWSTAISYCPWFIILWVVVETVFWYECKKKRQTYQQYYTFREPLSKDERRQLYWNCFHTVMNPEEWFTGWFYYIGSSEHPKFHEIYRDNVAIWFAWAFWVTELEAVRSHSDWNTELEWMISNVEEAFNIKFTDGCNPLIGCIRPDLDPVQYFHRPLIVYIANYLVTAVMDKVLLEWILGFQKMGTQDANVRWGHVLNCLDRLRGLQQKKNDKFQHLVYWYRKPKYFHHATTPIVFVHGIGVGLAGYMGLIYSLASIDRPLFCIELPYASMRLVDHIPTPKEMVCEIEAMLAHHGFGQAVFVAHSLGTAVASWVARSAPHRVGAMVLVDPICFLLNHHHVAFNILHRTPKRLSEYLVQYVVARELHVSYYLSRRFHWYESIAFVRQAPATGEPPQLGTCDPPFQNVCVFLSEKDAIASSTHVVRYLKGHDVYATVMSGLEHGDFLFDKQWKAHILYKIKQAVHAIDDEAIVDLEID